jgi:hypothetical protein
MPGCTSLLAHCNNLIAQGKTDDGIMSPRDTGRTTSSHLYRSAQSARRSKVNNLLE